MRKYEVKKLAKLSIYFGIILFFMINISAFEGGDGTLENPYQIENCTNLQKMTNNATANYILNNDINCTDTINWNSGAGFNPIGNESGFSGILDGKGYIINNLFINTSAKFCVGCDWIGLFGIVDGELKNVRLKNVNINYSGSDADIELGAIAGSLNGGANISNSYALGNVSGYRYVGGLIGDSMGIIFQSFSDINIIARQHHIGGLVGILASNGIINNSYARGNVTGDSAIGGLLGTINGGKIYNSYSTGNVSGIDSIGSTLGGLIGFENSAGTISNSFWDTDTSNMAVSVGGTGKTTQQMKTQSTYSTWDFNSTWRFRNSFESTSWDIIRIVFDTSFSVASQTTNPWAVFFKPDGTRMYLISTTGTYQYSLSQAWNVSTASYDNIYNLSITGVGIHFHENGTKVYSMGSDDIVHQYNLSQAWNLSTVSDDSVGFDISSQETNPDGIFIGNNGTKMYILGFTKKFVHQYNLSQAWNLSTASYDNLNFSVNFQGGMPTGVTFNPDGTKMFVSEELQQKIFQYSLSQAWNISTVSYDNVVNTFGYPRGLFFKEDGKKLFYGQNPSDSVFQYSLLLSGYPYLRVQDFSGGSGTLNDPYAISTCTQLQNMTNGLSLNYILNNDINCTDTINWNSGAGFNPIGNTTATSRFEGSLNGDGNIISNLFINRTSSSAQGLIGWLDGSISYIGLENVSITGKTWVGGIAGVIGDGTITKSYTTGNINGISGIGGIAGSMTGTSITNSYSKANITENSTGSSGLGGIVGNALYPRYSYATGNLTTNAIVPYTGGICPSGSGHWGNTYSYWDVNTTGQTDSCTDEENGKNTTNMKLQSTFLGWDFIDIWKLNTNFNEGYPYLTSFVLRFEGISTESGNFSQNSIRAFLKSKIVNPDTITVYLYNSTGIVQSNVSRDENLNINFSNLISGIYYLNASVNDTSDNKFYTGTRTIVLDTEAPQVTINKPTGNYTSRTVDYNVTLSESLSGYGTCIYWVKRGINFEISNTTVTCGNEISGSFIVTLDADYIFYFRANDSTGNINLSSSSFSVSPSPSATAGSLYASPQTIHENKTHCGDLICQNAEKGFPTGNDYGIQENYWNCAQDCPGAIGENFDSLIFSLTSYCWDKDPGTVCLWSQMFSVIPGTDATAKIIPFNGDTALLNCFQGKDCFWETSKGILILFLGVSLGLAIFMVKPFSVSGKKTNLPRYVVVKIKGKKRR